MNTDKPHYYDGKFYEVLIDPALREVRDSIIEQITADSTVIDLACGTGTLVFDLAHKCTAVTGVELSSKMVEHAKRRQQKNGLTNTYFVHGDATNLPNFHNQQFDYATISLALHEMSPALRPQVVHEAKRLAKKIIIADWVVPQPVSIIGIVNRLLEFLAGTEHFRGFNDFQKTNGIDKLLQNCQLTICDDLTNSNGTIRVVVAE